MRRALVVLSLLVAMSMVPMVEVSGIEPSRDLSGLTQHSPIRVDSNQAFQGIAASEGWSGDGSQADPYIISDLLINGNGYGYGIFIGNVTSHFIIRNCQVTDASGNWHFYYNNNGLYLYNSSNGLIDGCWFDNSSIGVYMFGSEYMTVTSSTFFDQIDFTIQGSDVNNITIENNMMISNGGGIYFDYFCDRLDIRDNRLEDCGRNGIGLGSLTTRNLIENNSIITCGNLGISLFNAEYNIVRYNTVKWCPVGIRVEMSDGEGSCRYNEISNNTVRENSVGIRSDGTYLNTYENNNISYSGKSGMEIGIASTNETIWNNDFFGNGGYGLFAGGDNCLAHGNAFIFNNNSDSIYNLTRAQARDDGVGNKWALNGRGNYWYDWTTPDNDSNGIVDVPYRFHGRITREDPFPLTEPLKPPIRKPSPPLNLKGITGRYFIQLSWGHPVSYPEYPVEGYLLYRNATGGGMDVIADLAPNILEFTDTPLGPGATYGYAVTAYNDAGESDLSNPVIRTVTDLYGAPIVQITNPIEGTYHPEGGIDVNWTVDLLGAELDHYEVSADGEFWVDVGTNTSHRIPDLTNLTTIYVRCVNSEGTIGTAKVSFHIDGVSPGIILLAPSPDALLNSSSVLANWTIVENGSGIQMVRIRIDDGNWTDVTDMSTFTFKNVIDADHIVVLEAIDNVGNSANRYIHFIVDTIPPSVLDVGPDGFDAERDETIYMDLGEEIDPSSVEFIIAPPTPGNLTVTPLRIEFVPDEPLTPGTDYLITIFFSDEAGNVVGPYQWSFRIAEYYLKGSVIGYVVDSYGEYVQGARVTVGNITVFTNIFGSFSLEILPGDHDVLIEKEGYVSYTGNLTLLPTQDLDLGKLVIEGGTSPIEEEAENDIPWIPIIVIIFIIGALAVGILTIKNRPGRDELDVEE